MITLALLLLTPAAPPKDPAPARGIERHLYVANDDGLLVYDITRNHRKIRKIPVKGGDFKGICASGGSDRLYLASHHGDKVICINLLDDKVLWERKYDAYVDSLAVTPDGATLYIPCRSAGTWVVANAISGEVVTRLRVDGKPHNTWCSPDGKHMYLSALENPVVTVVNARTHEVIRTVGPFGAGIRPFAVGGREKRIFVNVQDLLGFEIGDIESGKVLARVKVKRFEPVKGWHATYSHGIGIHPNQREVWVSNDAGKHLHIYDVTKTPPKWVADIPLSRDNGWISFSIDGRYCYPSSGDVIDAGTKKVIAKIPAPGKAGNEKVLEVQLRDGAPFRVGHR